MWTGAKCHGSEFENLSPNLPANATEAILSLAPPPRFRGEEIEVQKYHIIDLWSHRQ